VIRGGAYTPAELHDALLTDPVAAEHYVDFQQDRAMAIPAPETLRLYASYRVQDSIYWTRKPVTIPAGETLLTDGTNYARARCGSRLSETPQVPVRAADPDMDSSEPEDYSGLALVLGSPARRAIALLGQAELLVAALTLPSGSALTSGLIAGATAVATPVRDPLSALPPAPLPDVWPESETELPEADTTLSTSFGQAADQEPGVARDLAPQPVAEPMSESLVCIGLAGVLFFKGRRRARFISDSRPSVTLASLTRGA
jgi:hypothetical protein